MVILTLIMLVKLIVMRQLMLTLDTTAWYLFLLIVSVLILVDVDIGAYFVQAWQKMSCILGNIYYSIDCIQIFCCKYRSMWASPTELH